MLSPGEKETGAWGLTVAILATPFLVLGYEVGGGNWWVGGPVALASAWVTWCMWDGFWKWREKRH